MSAPWIRGYCPMGCGETLFIGAGGYITCSWLTCPNPTAVCDLLDNRDLSSVLAALVKTAGLVKP